MQTLSTIYIYWPIFAFPQGNLLHINLGWKVVLRELFVAEMN